MMICARFSLVFCLLCSIGMCFGCSSKSEQGAQSLAYAEDVVIEVEMGSLEDLHDMEKDDLLFTVTNKGDQSITKLLGEVVFLDSKGEEVGRTSWLFIWENEAIEKVASEDKKAKHRALPGGQTLKMGTDVIFFFGGEPELREEIVSQWDDLSVEIVLKEIVTK